MMRGIMFLLFLWLTMQADGQSLRELLTHQRVLLIAGHRGGFYDSVPENSLAAIDYTFRMSPTRVMVEFDLRKSKEGTIFVMHDETVDRTTNGRGKIAELSDSYLRSLRLKNSNGTMSSVGIPLFEEFLAYAKNHEIYLMLDVKADVWREALDMVDSFQLTDRCLVLTFAPKDTRRVQLISSNVMVSALVRNESDWAEIQKAEITTNKILAYVNENTSRALLKELDLAGVLPMSDVSEHTRQQGIPLSPESYRAILSRQGAGILITDFPVLVAGVAPKH